jgi:LPPG:FO 2-phospho-L-lactate transferase
MLRTLGHEVSALGVARLYEGLLNGFVFDRSDEQQADAVCALRMRPLVTDAVMRDGPDRERLAREVLRFCEGLR